MTHYFSLIISLKDVRELQSILTCLLYNFFVIIIIALELLLVSSVIRRVIICFFKELRG